MITLQRQPSDIMMARNPVLLGLFATQTNGQPYSGRGVAATLTAGAAAKFATGQTLTLTWTEPDGTTDTVVFTAAATLTLDTDLPDASLPGSVATYWERVRTIVGSHYKVAAHFNVTRTGPTGGNVLTIAARSLVTGWAVTLATSAPFTVAATPAVADSTPSNYRVLVEVFGFDTYAGGSAVLIGQLQGQPAPDGSLYFDLSSMLTAHCRGTRSEPLCPPSGVGLPVRADNVRRYYYRITEEFGDPPVVQPWLYGTVRKAMDGGVSQAIHAVAPYLDDITIDESLFTWQPDGQIVRPSAEYWVSWYNYTGSAKTILIEWQAWSAATGVALSAPQYAFFDETIPPAPSITVASQEVMQLPLAGVLGVSAFGAGVAYKVTFRVVDAASDWAGGNAVALSATRTYYLDWAYYEATRTLQWVNSFGSVETLCATGTVTQSANVERFTARRNLAPNADVLATDTFQYARNYRPTLTYRTGYIRRSDAAGLQEMLLAADIYDVSAGGYTPLRILTESFRVTDTREDLHAYEFEAALRLDLLNFSNKISTPATAGAWEAPSGAFWADALSMPWLMP